MGNRPNCLLETEARKQSPKDSFKNAALDLDRSMGALIEQPAHEAIALGRAVARRDSSTFLFTRAHSNPRSQMLLRRECSRCGAYLGDDLMSRLDSETGHLGKALNSLLVRTQQVRHLLIQLAHVAFD